MFSLGDKVTEVNTGTTGVIMDIDLNIDKLYGVLFDDDKEGIWWCSEKEIRKVDK